MANGTLENPITHDEDRGFKFCQCGDCKAIARCTQSNDFYAVPDSETLKCGDCLGKRIRNKTRDERKRRIERN